MRTFTLAWEACRELRTMPAGEVAFRIWHRLKKAGDRLDLAPILPGTGSRALDTHAPSRFFIDPAAKAAASQFLKEHYTVGRLLQEADDVCEHRFRLFRNQAKRFDGKIDWHFATGDFPRYPKVYFDRIRLADIARFGDVKWTWELNRHQHFYVLGRAYWATGNEKYAREFVDQVAGWIDDNPYLVGVNWTSPLEVAIRGIAWLWAYYFFLPSPHFQAIREKFLDMLLLKAWYINEYMTTNYSPSNHVIGEAAGLVQLGLFFSRHPSAGDWIRKAVFVLEREMKRQVFPSGESKEQSPGYHRFVLDFFTLSYLLGRMNGVSFSRDFRLRLGKMYHYAVAVLKPDGRAFSFGDCDDARVFRLSCRRVEDFRGVLSTGAELFRSPALKGAADGFDEESFWLLGKNGWKAFRALAVEQDRTESRAYPRSGFFLLRSRGSSLQVRFDCGAQGLPPNFAHGHADALSFEVVTEGKDALVDPGTYGYNIPAQWRQFFRSSFAHNTVIIDGRDQALGRRRFRWNKVPTSRCLRWGFGKAYDYVEGTHDGYLRLSAPVGHRRMVLFVKPLAFYVIDILRGSLSHQYEQLLHFAPGKVIRRSNGDIDWRGDKGASLRIQPLAFYPLESRIIEAHTQPPQGWVSSGYAEKGPAPVLSLTTCRAGQTILGFRISLPPGPQEDTVGSSSKKCGHLLVFKADSACRGELLVMSPGNLQWQFEDLESDAEMVFLDRHPSGKIISGLVVGGSFLSGAEGQWRFEKGGGPMELEAPGRELVCESMSPPAGAWVETN